MNKHLRCVRLTVRWALPVHILLAVGVSAEVQVVEVQAHGKVQAEVHQHPPSAIETGAVSRRQLVRSEEGLSFASAAVSKGLPSLDYVADGVPVGSCKNFKVDGEQEAKVSCPKPLKMVGCNCRDGETAKTGACGTEFSHPHTCKAFTKMGRMVSAYVRCCHMDWATSNFTMHTSAMSTGEDGAAVSQACLKGEILLGCACQPGDKPNRGCKHNLIEGSKCTATNLMDHPAGVRSQALCATLSQSSDWETVRLNEHVVDRSTNLSCSKPYPALQMISCSCGSSVGQCNGGKVIAHRCECNGARCFASARCAKIPIPPQDCIWQDWGEWSDCSKSCGWGTRHRVREIALLATNGGQPCDGVTKVQAKCKGDAKPLECVNAPPETVEEAKDSTLYLIVGITVFLTCSVGSLCIYWDNRRKQAAFDEEDKGPSLQQGLKQDQDLTDES